MVKWKETNYEVKFSPILILKDEIDKKNFEKKTITKIQKHNNNKKKSKTLWITIVIHSAIYVGEQWFPHTL
jgi:hypothetical protein